MNTYLVDTKSNDYRDFLIEAELLHEGGLLSKTSNVAGTQELIKVNHSKILKYECIVKHFDNTNREEIFKFFYNSEWQSSED
jgi:hypothetical protein